MQDTFPDSSIQITGSTGNNASLEEVKVSLEKAASNILAWFSQGADESVLLDNFNVHVQLHQVRIDSSKENQQTFQEIASQIRYKLLEDFRRALESTISN